MKILICSDGSEQAERATRLGATIAAASRAEVTLLGVAESSGHPDRILDALKRAQSLLTDKKIRAELITKPGHPLAEIVRRTEETAYDLVVIGAVRKQTGGRFWMSSLSYRIVKAIQPPVLIVAGQGNSIRRLLLCSSGRRFFEPAVRFTGEIARALGAQVTLLHVMPEPPALYAGLRRMTESADQLLASPSELGLNLRAEKELLESQSVAVQVRLRHGSVLQEILREVRLGEYDLVVTGSALSQSLRTYMLGDVSREIVNRISCAVLVVRTLPAGPSPFRFGWFARRQER
jgi:nucleotide-binding universal stress UspA family protein